VIFFQQKEKYKDELRPPSLPVQIRIHGAHTPTLFSAEPRISFEGLNKAGAFDHSVRIRNIRLSMDSKFSTSGNSRKRKNGFIKSIVFPVLGESSSY